MAETGAAAPRHKPEWSGNRPGGHKRARTGGVPQEPGADASATERQFFQYAKQLTAKRFQSQQDRHERLVKLSRDVTIGSKRAIFLLHRIEGESNRATIVHEAAAKLDEVRVMIGCIAKELKGLEAMQFSRAISPGLQEYVEAATFLAFNETGSLISIGDLNEQLHFGDHVSFQIEPSDYMLGVADLTGECMRMCINALGKQADTPSAICAFMRKVYEGFQRLPESACGRETRRKVQVMRNSLRKVEDACYTLKVRGAELPKERLSEALEAFSAAAAPERE